MTVVPTSVSSCQERFFKGQFFVDSGITSVVLFVLLSYFLCDRRPGGLCLDSRRQVTLDRPGCGKPQQRGWGTTLPPSSSEQQHRRARVLFLAPLQQVIDLPASEQGFWQQDP